MDKKVVRLVYCAIFTTLTIVGAFIRIPIPLVPFTMQYIFTMLAGALLGRKLGAISIGMYVILGLAGLPIFAKGGGIGYIFNPSFGYIIGFVIGAYVTGYIIDKHGTEKISWILIANYAGMVIVYTLGVIHLYVIKDFYLNQPIGIWPLFLNGVFLTIPSDIILCYIGAFIVKRLRPTVQRAIY